MIRQGKISEVSQNQLNKDSNRVHTFSSKIERKACHVDQKQNSPKLTEIWQTSLSSVCVFAFAGIV